jgi:hypothetical protein
MPSLYNANLKPLESGGSTHPYDHATKLFVADNMRLAPKQSFLYYVCINIDVGILQNLLTNSQSLQDPASTQSLVEQYETGLLAKRVDLPKFTISAKTMNAYNRKNIIQTNISYDPISITFHDDAADVVNKFWNDYYTYYYRDSDYDASLYGVPHKYQPRLREGWGYTPRNGTTKSFLRNIQIFSLHNKRFTEYLLINPYITSWRHGEHNAESDAGIMENQMTIAYETVKYRTGFINPVDVNGFAVVHYDNFNSPISQSTTNIYTDAGVLGALDGASKDLARPDGTGSGSGVLGSILGAYRSYNQLKGANFSSLGSITLGQIGSQIINSAINGAINNIFVPTTSGSSGYGTVYGSSQVYNNSGVITSYPYAAGTANAGATIAGNAVNQLVGAAVNSVLPYVNRYVQGLTTNQSGAPVTTAQQTVYQFQGTNSNTVPILVNAQGQPLTQQLTYSTYDTQGNFISTEQTLGDSSGTYNPNNSKLNLQSLGTYVGQDGQTMYAYNYSDGTRRIVSDNGLYEQIIPGSNYGKPVVLVGPTDTRDLAANGQTINPAAQQYYTVDGVTYVVNPTGGQATNIVAQGVSAIGGGFVGASLYEALSQTGLGKTVVGQAVAGAASSALAMATSKAIESGLTPIFNKISQDFTQGINNLTGAITNKIGSWVGSGGYNPMNITQNIASKSIFDDGSTLFTYKDGTTLSIDQDGVRTVLKTGTNSGSDWWSLGSKTPGVNVDGVASSTGPATIWLDGSGNPIVSGSGGYVTTIGDNSVFLGGGQDQAITSYFESGAGEYYNPLNDSVIDYTAGGIDYPIYDDFAALGVDL